MIVNRNIRSSQKTPKTQVLVGDSLETGNDGDDLMVAPLGHIQSRSPGAWSQLDG